MARSTKKIQPAKSFSQKNTAQPFWKDLCFFGCLFSGMLFALMVVALLNPESGVPKVREVIRITHQFENDVQQLHADNALLVQQIEGMKTDPFWQEKIAREELNMALPDEIIYKFSE